jgi:hypothetical protein
VLADIDLSAPACAAGAAADPPRRSVTPLG